NRQRTMVRRHAEGGRVARRPRALPHRGAPTFRLGFARTVAAVAPARRGPTRARLRPPRARGVHHSSGTHRAGATARSSGWRDAPGTRLSAHAVALLYAHP